MIRKALRRANRSYVFTLVLALLFAAGYVGSTYAYFDGTVNQTATYAGGTIGLPTLIGSPVVKGYGASFGWTPAAIGLNSQAIFQFDNGSTSACGSPTYTALTTGLTTTLATTTLAGTSTQNGHYMCYEVRSTHGSPSGTTSVVYTITTANGTTVTSTTPTTVVNTLTGSGWYQATNFASVQVGLVPTAVTVSNSNNTLGNNDKVTIVYNQTVSTPSTPVTVMVCQSLTAGQGKVVIGASSCAATPSIGAITGLTMTQNTTTKTFTGTVSATASTVIVNLTGQNTPATGTGSFVPAGSGITSSVGSATVCNCTTITPTGHF